MEVRSERTKAGIYLNIDYRSCGGFAGIPPGSIFRNGWCPLGIRNRSGINIPLTRSI